MNTTQTEKSNVQGAEKKIWNVFFCGTGGQGVLTASEIAGIAAMIAGYHVKKSEVHGMAQRGGSVESHLRFGEKIYSPLINPGEADYLVAFHTGEGKRMSSFLKKDGVSLVGYLEDPKTQPADKRFVNTFYLGILSAYLPIPSEAWHQALRGKLKRFLKENIEAFDLGKNIGTKARES